MKNQVCAYVLKRFKAPTLMTFCTSSNQVRYPHWTSCCSHRFPSPLPPFPFFLLHNSCCGRELVATAMSSQQLTPPTRPRLGSAVTEKLPVFHHPLCLPSVTPAWSYTLSRLRVAAQPCIRVLFPCCVSVLLCLKWCESLCIVISATRQCFILHFQLSFKLRMNYTICLDIHLFLSHEIK